MSHTSIKYTSRTVTGHNENVFKLFNRGSRGNLLIWAFFEYWTFDLFLLVKLNYLLQ